MGGQIFGDWAQGASHERVEKVCQDSWKKIDYLKGAKIATVADGHGSENCPYSDEGSKAAVKIFCNMMKDCYESFTDLSALQTFLNREGDLKIAQSIDREWKTEILSKHKSAGRDMSLSEEEICKMYGTTLLGIMITDNFVFAFQLGDGDITFVDDCEITPVINADKFLGVETHSLSKKDAWKHAISAVINKDASEDLPYMYMLSTDGLANSFTSQDEFYKTCRDYFEMIKEHGAKIVKDNLRQWLTETSQMGCGDDITAVFVYYK
jgi:serine/threonine protein phosphatase PrpC